MRGRVICLEGCSAVGKTTLARALAARLGAPVFPELDATGAPLPPNAEPWFATRHAARSQAARAAAQQAGVAILDTDPLKGLWYNWMHTAEGWPDTTVVGPCYRQLIATGELSFPDLYIYLDADERQLAARRANDPSRSRRAFAKHLGARDLQRSYFSALRDVARDRVVFLETTDRDGLPDHVIQMLALVPAEPPDSLRLLEHMIGWIQSRVAATAEPRGKR